MDPIAHLMRHPFIYNLIREVVILYGDAECHCMAIGRLIMERSCDTGPGG